MSKRTPKIKKNTTQKVSDLSRSRVSAVATFGNPTFLYRFVYSTKISFAVAVLLLLSFTLQGVETTYAAEEETPQQTVDESVTEEVANEAVVQEDEESAPEEETLPSANTETEVSNTPTLEETLPTPDKTAERTEPEEVITQNDEEPEVAQKGIVDEENQSSAENESTVQEDDASEENVDEPEVEVEPNPETESESETENESQPNPDEADGQDEDVLDTDSPATDAETEVSTTTEEVIEISENTFETVSLVESDSAFSFTKDQCTQLATGSFYCLEPQENRLADALFAAQDEEGDMEIYFIRNNEQAQITDNNVDDAAPFYDQNTHTIVWHRLVDDRFQIISYDIESGKETQLTRTSENNMEPNRQGNFTVWQRWIDGGWNIILFDGDTETQLTKTTSHNVAPYIHGTLVVWNRHTAAGEKTIEMFDITTQAYVTIDDPDGLSVANPRMVFVYDSLHPNGDIVTKGYDVLARKFIELDTLPRDLPDEIPHSDSTGETRALIQSKPSLKSEVEEVSAGNGTTTPPVLPPTQPATTTAETLTLDLSATTTTEPVLSEPVVELENFDLVIPAFQPSLSSSSQAVQES